MSRPPRFTDRRTTFVDLVLDGRAGCGDLAEAIAAWEHGDRHISLEAQLGLTAAELAAVRMVPDAVRYVIHARRFGGSAPTSILDQGQLNEHATRIAASHVDPYELADLELWRDQIRVTTRA